MNKIFRKSRIAAALLVCVFLQIAAPAALAQQAQSTVDSDAHQKLRKEASDNSQIMRTTHFFADVYGPRLTGSPNLRAAGEWAVKQMKEWGFDDARLEPWNFGHAGWVSERAAGFITSPVQDSLVFEVLAWTPSTKGAAVGEAFQMILPERPTQAELTAYFDSIKQTVAGKIVLIGKPATVPVNFEPVPKRLDDEALRRRFGQNAVTAAPPPQVVPSPSPSATPRAGQLNGQQIGEQLNRFLLESGALVRVNDAGRGGGQIRAFANQSYDVTKTVPTVILRNEDFGRIIRILNDKNKVSLEFDIRNRVVPEGATAYNVIGEIAGTDKRDEVIMLGGHLDSWHAATGATDNAIGCAVMMEAARLIKASGLKPRRTIRVALWSGEEQGLLGSQAYVKQHFGTAENPLPEFAKFGGYFNIDSGTGRARGMSVFGTTETAQVLRGVIAPFADLGVAGVVSTASRGLGGSDHTTFNQAGLPGIGVAQDPIEYFTDTWHTNLDTYERIIEDDAKKSAVVIAAAVYNLAMRDELLPRFKPADLPKPPAAAALTGRTGE